MATLKYASDLNYRYGWKLLSAGCKALEGMSEYYSLLCQIYNAAEENGEDVRHAESPMNAAKSRHDKFYKELEGEARAIGLELKSQLQENGSYTYFVTPIQEVMS